MWYGVLDGEVWLETKIKSQKAVNLRRDPRFTFMIEDGDTYDTLRGVSLEGTAEIVDDPVYVISCRSERLGALYRPLHRRDEACRRHDDEQATMCAVDAHPHTLVGPSQAGTAGDATVGIDSAKCNRSDHSGRGELMRPASGSESIGPLRAKRSDW